MLHYAIIFLPILRVSTFTHDWYYGKNDKGELENITRVFVAELYDDYKSQMGLVDYLRSRGYIKSERVAQVMYQVDRKYYATHYPYQDREKVTRFGILDAPPRTTASMLELLKDHLKEGTRILDVGYASGYSSVCLAEMVGPTAHVTAVEYMPEQVAIAKYNVINDHNFRNKGLRVNFMWGNASDVATEHGPFDAINITPAVGFKVPDYLFELLNVGGRMLIPTGRIGCNGTLMIFDKDNEGRVSSTNITDSIYIARILWPLSGILPYDDHDKHVLDE